tara:strand:- start:38 stop:1207 length:1170 start_codon:yes stop_codon:yes gene_type:complete
MTTSQENTTGNQSTSLSQEKPLKSSFTSRDEVAFENARNWDEFLVMKAAEDNCKFTRFLDRNNFLEEHERNKIYNIEVERALDYSKAFREIVEIVCKTKFPIAIESASSGEKQFFRDPNKVLCHKYWNERGLHVLRIIFAWYIHQDNTKRITTNIYQLREHGVTTIENFAPKDCIKPLKKEIKKFPKGPVHKVAGSNIISELSKNEFPYLRGLSGMISNVALSMIGRQNDSHALQLHEKNLFVQRVVNEPDDQDIQKTFHSDVFFPAIKYWWFPREVELQGAFEYGLLSTRLTNEVLDWHYKQSLSAIDGDYESWRGDGHKEGSFRVAKDEMQTMGVTQKHFTVPANTLVIANVFGFHRRGHTNKKVVRDAVHGSIRVDNPFELMNNYD